MPVKYLLCIYIAMQITFWGLCITTNYYQKVIEMGEENSLYACVFMSIAWLFYLSMLTQ